MFQSCTDTRPGEFTSVRRLRFYRRPRSRSITRHSQKQGTENKVNSLSNTYGIQYYKHVSGNKPIISLDIADVFDSA